MFASCARAHIGSDGSLLDDSAAAYNCVASPVRQCLLRDFEQDHDSPSYDEGHPEVVAGKRNLARWRLHTSSILSAIVDDIQLRLQNDPLMCRYEDVLFQATASLFVKEIITAGVDQWQGDLMTQHGDPAWSETEKATVRGILNLLSPVLFPKYHRMLVGIGVDFDMNSKEDDKHDGNIRSAIGSEVGTLTGDDQWWGSEVLATYLHNHAVCMMILAPAER